MLLTALANAKESTELSKHEVSVCWEVRDGEEFLKNTYSRVHEWIFDGGPPVRASSSPSVVPLPLSASDAVDPEEAFVAALSSCHMLWFLGLASQAGVDIAGYEDHAIGEMARIDGRVRFSGVRLHPVVTLAAGCTIDEATHIALHEEAHHECFLANSVNFPVHCDPTLRRAGRGGGSGA